MADEATYLVKLAAWLARALGEGSTFAVELDTDAFGTRLPEVVVNDPSVRAAGEGVTTAGTALAEAGMELEAAAESNDTAQIVASFALITDGLANFFSALDDLAAAIDAQFTPAVLPDPAERAAAEALAAELARAFADYLILTALESTRPRLMLLLKLFGLIEWEERLADPTNALSQRYVRKRLNLSALADLIQDPPQHLADVIGWGDPGFDPTDLFLIVAGFYHEEDDLTIGEIDGDPFIRRGIFQLRRDSTLSPPGLRLKITTGLDVSASARAEVGEQWGLGIDSSLTFSGGASASIAPPLQLSAVPELGELTGSFQLYVNRNPSARPFSIVGEEASVLIVTADDASIGIQLDAAWDAVQGKALVQPVVFSELQGLTLKIGAEGADGFVAELLSGEEVEGRFGLSLEWRAEEGLVIRASGGVEIAIPIHKNLGVVRFNTLYLALAIEPDGALALEVSTQISALLGPLNATVERMGVLSRLRFSDDSDVAFGFFDADLGFKPPNGVGLSIDTGVIKGGGYLFIDAERGEYAGALELTFSEWIELKAVGLISTRLPDRSQGFSLLIIITVEFGSGIQLGLGFTLLGVGGLLGLNRRTDIEPLRNSIKTGAVERIMFPQNVIENAPRIISDLRQFFPAESDSFLVGPMVKIGWGTPTLLSLSMGVVIELPDPTITILGVLKVALPTEEADILRLQVNFIGRIEFDNELAWFYAELFDSRVLYITLEGKMGVLVKWGDQPNFVVGVGGFHPDYTPPPLPFAAPSPIAASLLNEPYARIRIEGYFAVTSNSVQFGARAELFFGLSEFRIEGHLGFDVLFQFSPFYFAFRLSVRLSVKVFGVGLFNVGFSGVLEGPTPWHIKGKGSISLLLISISVPFEHTWGERRQTELPPIEVLPLLEAELEAVTNWRAELPAGAHLLVSLRQLGDDPADELVLHPIGRLAVSQRKVPLEIELEKFGNQKPSDVRELRVSAATGDFEQVAGREEQFAIGHFKDLDEQEKISKPAFQPLPSGLDLSAAGEETRTSGATARTLRYEQILIDGAFRERIREAIEALLGLLAALFARGRRTSTRQSELSRARRVEMQPLGRNIELRPDQHTVVRKANNRPVEDLATVTFNSALQAQDYLAKQKRRDPRGARQLHVIPATEVNLTP